MDMMRALVKHPDQVGLQMEEVPVPSPGPDDVLIRVERQPRERGAAQPDVETQAAPSEARTT